jgi:hypothetical protein
MPTSASSTWSETGVEDLEERAAIQELEAGSPDADEGLGADLFPELPGVNDPETSGSMGPR